MLPFEFKGRFLEGTRIQRSFTFKNRSVCIAKNRLPSKPFDPMEAMEAEKKEKIQLKTRIVVYGLTGKIAMVTEKDIADLFGPFG